MKKTSITLLVNLLLSSTLLWRVSVASAEEIVKIPVDTSTYCHMKFPPLREDTLTWNQPVLDESAGNIIDFYGSCDHDPMGRDEINLQRNLLLRDGERE